MRRLFLLTVMVVVMCVAMSQGVTILLDHGADFAGGAAGNQATIDFFTDHFPDATVIAGNYDNTADASVQAAIAAADVLVLCRTTSSGGYDAADGIYYSGLSIPVVFLTSYVTRNSRIVFEGGLNAGASTDGAETTVTAAGALVFGYSGIAAGSYDWYTDGYGFDTLGTGGVGTGDILATIGGNHLAVGWNTGDTNGAGTAQNGPRLLFNLSGNGNTLPDTAAGKQALLDAINAYTLLGVSPFAVTLPDPAKGAEVDLATLTELSWQDSSDPNIASVEYDVVFGTEPNLLLNSTYIGVSNPLNLAENGIYLDYEIKYYWRVDTTITWDSNEVTGNLHEVAVGEPWFFTTLPDDKAPDVTADASGMDILTSPEFLPANLTGTVNDLNEGDIQSVIWKVIGTNAPAVSMQMFDRGSANALANLAQITAAPNLLRDWIGTDTRDNETDKPLGNPMVLTLKGLPADTYTWKSYHHDPDVTNSGMFDVTVIDASGKTVTPDVRISDSNEPIATLSLLITSNGTDDVALAFDLHPYVGLGYNDAWFAMNGFELTGTSGSLYIDFGTSGTDRVMSGYEVYYASNEVPSSFTEQSYSAFGTTVSILPTWGGLATVTDTTVNLLSPTATLDTDWPGSYIVQLSASDNSWTSSDTMTVRVAADACSAAQAGPAFEFNLYDVDGDCDVDLSDFAALARQWLDDRNATGQIQL